MKGSQKRFSDEIRAAIVASGKSCYAICQQMNFAESAMSKFMNDRGGLSLEVLDRLAAALDLHVSSKQSKGTVPNDRRLQAKHS